MSKQDDPPEPGTAYYSQQDPQRSKPQVYEIKTLVLLPHKALHSLDSESHSYAGLRIDQPYQKVQDDMWELIPETIPSGYEPPRLTKDHDLENNFIPLITGGKNVHRIYSYL